jgi:hypothetical protein
MEKDIESWKEARLLVRAVYQLFANVKDYGFRDQIQRASISVISEPLPEKDEKKGSTLIFEPRT